MVPVATYKSQKCKLNQYEIVSLKLKCLIFPSTGKVVKKWYSLVPKRGVHSCKNATQQCILMISVKSKMYISHDGSIKLLGVYINKTLCIRIMRCLLLNGTKKT